MKGRRIIVWFLAVGIMILGASSAWPAQASTPGASLPPLSAAELCGDEPPAEISCPKTGAPKCLCFMGTRAPEKLEMFSTPAAPSRTTRVPRPGRRLTLLPSPPVDGLRHLWASAPPTRPPCL